MQNPPRPFTRSFLKHAGLLAALPMLLLACEIDEQTRERDPHTAFPSGPGGELGPDGKNACGGTKILPVGPNNPCGQCGSGIWECVAANEVVCMNDRGCFDPRVEMTDLTNITTRSASLTGTLVELGAPKPTSLGFCLTVGDKIDTPPTLQGGADCFDAVATPDNTGPFTGTHDQLEPGTIYTVSAFASRKLEESERLIYGRPMMFSTQASSPLQVTTTNEIDLVRISWQEVSGALAYDIIRDGEHVATVADQQLSFDDLRASPGTPKAPQLNVISSEDAIALQWDVPEALPGQDHKYRVIALNLLGIPGTPSDEVTGHRLPRPFTKIDLFVISNGYNDVVKTFLPTDAIDGTFSWTVTDTLPPTLEIKPELTATNATRLNHVLLKSPIATVNPAPSDDYYLRVHDDTLRLSDDSEPVTAQRTAGEISYQWQRSNTGNQADFLPLSCDDDITCADCEPDELFCADATASTSGNKYLYRLTATAPGTEPATSNSKEGARAVPGIAFTNNLNGAKSESSLPVTIALQNQYKAPLAHPGIDITATLTQRRAGGPPHHWNLGEQTTDLNGQVTFNVPFDSPGTYWLEASFPNNDSIRTPETQVQ